MTNIVEIDPRDITITPVFKYVELENVPKSETAGHAVMETHEVCEVRFAGQRNYAPVFPAHAQYRREGNRVITYAERWADQYRAFKEGSPQEALGTPLEMLRPLGVTPELISLCRAMKIYSIEALHHLEGAGRKALGMNGNTLKAAAAAYMAERQTVHSAASEIEALRAEIAELKARSTHVPPTVTPDNEVEAMLQAADDAYTGMTDAEIKDEIENLTGARPRGNPSRATLVNALEELKAA